MLVGSAKVFCNFAKQIFAKNFLSNRIVMILLGWPKEFDGKNWIFWIWYQNAMFVLILVIDQENFTENICIEFSVKSHRLLWRMILQSDHWNLANKNLIFRILCQNANYSNVFNFFSRKFSIKSQRFDNGCKVIIGIWWKFQKDG